jgi:hypothetical protein
MRHAEAKFKNAENETVVIEHHAGKTLKAPIWYGRQKY